MNYFSSFYSNKTEQLYTYLKTSLFSSSHPLSKRIVIVPSHEMKNWLLLKIAKDRDISIATGIEVACLEKSIGKIKKRLTSNKDFLDNEYTPSNLEIALALETIILDLIKTSEIASPIWEPLRAIFSSEKEIETLVSCKNLQRLSSFSVILAAYFIEVGIYCRNIDLFIKKNHMPEWLVLLWMALEKKFLKWNYPIREMVIGPIENPVNTQSLHIHVFLISFLSPLYHRFFQQISKEIPVSFYNLSPCQKFLGDLLSDKEGIKLKRFLEKQKINKNNLESLEEVLSDSHPLLANWGRIGRETFRLIEEGDPEIIENYILPYPVKDDEALSDLLTDEVELEETDRPLSLLEVIQSDMALMRTLEDSKKIDLKLYDYTVQVHAAPKIMREVEVVYDVIMGIIDRHENTKNPILPSDILIMAPAMFDYIPFVKSVFDSDSSQLKIHIEEGQLERKPILVEAFIHLLSLSKGRFENSLVLKLFEDESFKDKFQLSFDDIIKIKNWVDKASIKWGHTSQHRQEVMTQDYQELTEDIEMFEGTWQCGLERLLKGLIEISSFDPVVKVSFSEASLLGTFIQIISSLQQDLKILSDKTSLTLKEWSAYLKCLLESYFSAHGNKESAESFKELSSCLEIFSLSSRKLQDATFSFDCIYSHLINHVEKSVFSRQETTLQAVRFSSFLPMRVLPARVIILMGMGEGKFPRTTKNPFFKALLNNKDTDYFPEMTDLDRYLFLETLLFAKEYFVVSYVSQAPRESHALLSSLLVRELIQYIDKATTIATQKSSEAYCFNHSLNAFNKQYFLKEARFKSFQKTAYKNALAYYQAEKLEEPLFIESCAPLSIPYKIKDGENLLDLKDLNLLAKDPLKFYCNKKLNIYFNFDAQNQLEDTEELQVSPLDLSILSKKLKTRKEIESDRKIPQGSFKDLSLEKIIKQQGVYKENLKYFNQETSSLFSMTFNDHYDEVKKNEDENCWHLPALMVETKKWGQIKISGVFESVCDEGLVFFEKSDVKKVLSSWPKILIFAVLLKRHTLPIRSNVLFIKGEAPDKKAIDFDLLEELLENYIEYYFEAKETPSPLATEWIPSIILGDRDKLQKPFQKDNSPYTYVFVDKSRAWLEGNSKNFSIEPIEYWQNKAQILMSDLLVKWYPKIKIE